MNAAMRCQIHVYSSMAFGQPLQHLRVSHQFFGASEERIGRAESVEQSKSEIALARPFPSEAQAYGVGFTSGRLHHSAS